MAKGKTLAGIRGVLCAAQLTASRDGPQEASIGEKASHHDRAVPRSRTGSPASPLKRAETWMLRGEDVFTPPFAVRAVIARFEAW